MHENERARTVARLHKALELIDQRDADYNGKDIWFDWEELDRIREAIVCAIPLVRSDKP